MKCNSIEEARQQAQRNADYTGLKWAVFVDTSGNARCERVHSGWSYKGADVEVFSPAVEAR